MNQQDVQFIDPFLIEWEQGRQFEERSSSFGEPIQQFAPSFAERGWDAAQGVVKAHEVKTKKEADALIKERQNRLAEWQALGDKQIELYTVYETDSKVPMTYAELAVIAEKVWTDDNGEWLRPKYRGICCYRRGYALPAAIAAYQSYNGGDAMFEIPVIVKEFANDDEEFLERLRENEQRGRVGYGVADQLAIAARLVKIGKSESEIEDLLQVKRGQAQRLHTWASLVRKFPKLDLINRARMEHPRDDDGKLAKPIPYEKGGFYPLQSATAKQGRTLLGTAKKVDSMDDMAVEAMGHQEPGRGATEQQVEKFLSILCEGRRNAPKMMEKSTINTFAQSESNPDIAAIFNGILENDGPKVSNAIDNLRAAVQAAEVS